MYKLKPYADCVMPANDDLKVLALNGSLKHEPEISNTDELTREVIKNMAMNMARNLVYYAQLLKQHPMSVK